MSRSRHCRHSISLVGRLFCIADKINAGVVKLFWRDAMVEDGSDGHWQHLRFEWWLGFLI
ncbi:hypothetical protein DEO72_LG5g1280 [Vigna unguiculata]|uniref:Uncharacterized protein n=1 Tax=Vigna unguiculata TaxID=3917 RepID=A0A4D6LY05_VIGUN|nr:hypothetical protein DEO72_LG5g1280 [Vigna unguiculata]